MLILMAHSTKTTDTSLNLPSVWIDLATAGCVVDVVSIARRTNKRGGEEGGPVVTYYRLLGAER